MQVKLPTELIQVDLNSVLQGNSLHSLMSINNSQLNVAMYPNQINFSSILLFSRKPLKIITKIRDSYFSLTTVKAIGKLSIYLL